MSGPARNRLKEALLLLAADMEWMLARHLSREEREAIAEACRFAAAGVDERLAFDVPEGPERDEVMLGQMFAREVLGGIMAARLVWRDEDYTRGGLPAEGLMPQAERESLVLMTAWCAIRVGPAASPLAESVAPEAP